MWRCPPQRLLHWADDSVVTRDRSDARNEAAGGYCSGSVFTQVEAFDAVVSALRKDH